LLADLKARVRAAQVRAVLPVNRELVLLYWHIGGEILRCQREEGWGAKVVERLARDLRAEFPEIGGFSARNLKYMRAFAAAYSDGEFVQQVVAQIPWGHNLLLLNRGAVTGSGLESYHSAIYIPHRYFVSSMSIILKR
jgi:predicted nuclease of restriction endonuclease-like (RecB) superfamily